METFAQRSILWLQKENPGNKSKQWPVANVVVLRVVFVH